VLLAVVFLGIITGSADIHPGRALLEVLDRMPGIPVASGLEGREGDIVYELRMPRVALGALVGAMLGMAGAAYQGVFRNPLADPYLLGVAAGAGLGATVVIAFTDWASAAIAPAAFVGALAAVAVAYSLSWQAGRARTGVILILAGVAVASFFTAVQAFLQQQRADTIRQVFSWILGRLSVAGWTEVLVLFPYVVITGFILILYRRQLDVLAVGELEAGTLGMNVERSQLVIVVAATLGTAAAVAVSGLIGFVGIVVPHALRLTVGYSYRLLVPLSALYGAAFLVAADLVARTAVSGAEMPIGVVTAFIGGPFFALILVRTARGLQA
jgi:iron complex transport system permease protein